MTVEHLLRSMSMRELLEWRLFLTVERSGAATQKQLDIDDQARKAFAPLMGLLGKGSDG